MMWNLQFTIMSAPGVLDIIIAYLSRRSDDMEVLSPHCWLAQPFA